MPGHDLPHAHRPARFCSAITMTRAIPTHKTDFQLF